MFRLLHTSALMFSILCIPAQSQPSSYMLGDPNKCSRPGTQDSWNLEPSEENPGEYLFTYTNNIHECSINQDGLLVTAPDGFTVFLYVQVGANDAQDELIYIIPQDIQYQPWPADTYAPDSSDPVSIRLIPGVS